MNALYPQQSYRNIKNKSDIWYPVWLDIKQTKIQYPALTNYRKRRSYIPTPLIWTQLHSNTNIKHVIKQVFKMKSMPHLAA